MAEGERVAATTGLSGMTEVMEAFLAAPAGAEITLQSGTAEDDPSTLLLVLSVGNTRAALTLAQAEVLADICEETRRRYAGNPQTAGLRELGETLRSCMAKLRKPH